MKKLIPLLCLFLSGCAHVQVNSEPKIENIYIIEHDQVHHLYCRQLLDSAKRPYWICLGLVQE